MVDWNLEIYSFDDLEILIMRILISAKKPLNINQIYQRVSVSQYLKFIDDARLLQKKDLMHNQNKETKKELDELIKKYGDISKDYTRSSEFFRWLLIYLESRVESMSLDGTPPPKNLQKLPIDVTEYRSVIVADTGDVISEPLHSEVNTISLMLSYSETEAIRKILKNNKIKVVSFDRIKDKIAALQALDYIQLKTHGDSNSSFFINPQKVLKDNNYLSVFFSFTSDRYNLDGFLW